MPGKQTFPARTKRAGHSLYGKPTYMVKSDYQQQSYEQAKAIVHDFSKWVNAMGHDNRVFAEAMMLEHRTLQQQMFETMLCCIDAWSKVAHHDARNEFAVMKSREIMALFPGGTRVPFI
jgi:hypothetical protein